jgi:eukaryotic-like serine/threonine-protein kinase
MAPEQVRGLPVDERTDLFALGVVLWELLCDRALFDRGTEGPTLMAVLSAEVPAPTLARGGLDPMWDEFLLKALARDPTHRYASAADMAAALARLPESLGPGCADELARLVTRLAAVAPPPRDGDGSGSSNEDPPATIVDPSASAPTRLVGASHRA